VVASKANVAGAQMFDRLLLFASLLGLSITLAQAQPSPARPTPEACQASSAEALPELEKRRQALERDIAQQITTVERISKRKDGQAGVDAGTRAKELRESLRSRQEDLLEVLFRIECVRAPGNVPEASSRNPFKRPGQAKDAIEVTTYYATNRKQTGSVEPASVYGAVFESTLQYGRAIVSIPPTHTPGKLELPSLWKLERDVDPSKHFVLKAVIPLNADAGRREMAQKLQAMSSKSLLVFVHGYNMGFRETALRTAQMAHDLNFPGMAFFYSWPSANHVRSYWQDEEIARLSESVFEQLIDELSQLPVNDIYVVAHSMGNRIVGHALQARADKGKQTKKLRELLLAAADINADVFRTVIAPKLAAMQGTRTPLYASSSDMALKASKVIHGFRRVGETTGGVVIYPGIETIDASSGSAALRGFGHFYVVDSPSVIGDIKSLIEKKVAAKLRAFQWRAIIQRQCGRRRTAAPRRHRARRREPLARGGPVEDLPRRRVPLHARAGVRHPGAGRRAVASRPRDR
jgi:esterase/lipase superfamily enzyme